jgi:internalin A
MEQALRLIKEAKEQRLTRLDLGNCGLTELPDALFELTWLEELILSGQWSEYSFEKKGWESFESQNQGEANNIKFISPNIKILRGLTKMIANDQKDLSDLIPLKNLSQLQSFSISKTQVSDLTPLSELRLLQSLYVSDTQVSDLTPLKDLMQLQLLYVSSTQVSDLTPLKNLKSLRDLKFNGSNVSDLSPLAFLENLEILWADCKKVKDLSPLKMLVNLKDIQLFKTEVIDLNPLKDLIQLRNLCVSETQVSDLNPLKDLLQLQQLDVSSTQVSDLNPLKDLLQLQQLDVSSTQVSDLSPLKDLHQLQLLRVSSTQVSDLSPLKDLQQLQQLSVYDTQVSDLSPLKDLQQLQQLSVYDTQVSDLSPLKDLQQLQLLFVYDTQVSDLSPLKKIIEKGVQVKWSKYGNGINIEGCPLTNPPMEIVEQGNQAILNYWKQIEEQGGSETINEAKLIIVGEGKSGKTTLFNKLIEPDYVLETLDETHGINIHEGLEMKEGFRANLWDFGGQELQYMTHQFFLTPRALYVLMMDARAESPNLAYWFKIISLLGKHSRDEKIQLLIVSNKHKEDTTGTPQYQALLKDYEDDFNYHFFEVNFKKNDKRWECLKEAIESQMYDLPIVKNALPKKWKPIREALREEAKSRAHIDTFRLAQICTEYGVTDEKQQWQMTQYLHQLGSLLHFQNDEDLMDLVILSPEWAVEGVYTTLKSELIKEEKKGKFSADDIFTILGDKGYSKSDAQKILKLMSKNNFDICYKSENGIYVAAQLLPNDAPPQYQWHIHKGALQFRYQYATMPKGLISRLIVRLSHDIEVIDGVDVVWKKGVVLSMTINGSVCRVMINEEAESKSGLMQIIVEVMEDKSPYINRKYALQKVRQEVESLHHKWFRNINVEQIVPCNCDACKRLDKPYTYLLSGLIELTKGYAFCNYLEDRVPITQLLEGVYGENEIKSFISTDDLTLERSIKSLHNRPPFSIGNMGEVEELDFSKKYKPMKMETTEPIIEKKTIKIFLASSNELKAEREAFELHFGARKRKTFAYDLEVVLWEDFIDAMSPTRLQDEYNKALKDCDIFVMLFFSKVGMYTAEEFEKAFGHFQENGKPLIYTYFKESNLNTANINRRDLLSLLDFQDKLKELGHFSTHYKDETDLNFQFSNQLEKLLKDKRI